MVLRNVTMTLNAVAICTTISNVGLFSTFSLRWSRCLPIAKCPLLLMGRNSVSPCSKPSSNASITFIAYAF